MFGGHLGSLDCGDDDVCSVNRVVSSLRAGFQPVVVVGRHKDEFAAPVPGDFDWLALRSADAEAINSGLSPSDSDISWAHEFVDQFNSSGGKPKDGSDLPRLSRARSILKRARQLGLISS